MRNRAAIAVSVATVLVSGFATAKLYAAAGDEFKPIAHDRQLFSDWTSSVMHDDDARVGWASMWPGIDGNKDVVTSDRIPDDVRNEAGRWIRATLKSEWVPATWPQNLIGVRNQYLGADVLVGRYTKGAYDVQLIERVSVLQVLVKPHTEPLRGTAPEADFMALIKGCAAELIRFPEEKLGAVTFTLTQRAKEGDRVLYSGVMNCEYELGRTENWSWWNHMMVWTDGEVVSLGLAKMDGQPRGRQAIASTGKRFKDGD